MTHRQPPGASAPEKPPRSTRNPAMQLGMKPERKQDPDSSRTARRHDHCHGRRQAAPPAAQAGRAEDRPRPRQHAHQVDAPRLDSSPPPPRPADPDHLHKHRQRRHDRQQDRGPPPATIPAPAAGPPHGPPRTHRAPTANAPPLRPTPSPTPPRTPTGPATPSLLLYNANHRRQPATRPRWTAGQAADSSRHSPGPRQRPGHNP